MSHFTVMVRVKRGEELESVLAPYQENNMGDCPKEYLAFNDVTNECQKVYNDPDAKTSVFASPDGKLHQKYDDKFRVSDPREPFKSSQYVCPSGWTEKEVQVKELYTFEQFVTDYHGYRKDPETGRFGYWENPNAKWDWYQIGGRWPGKLDGGNSMSVGNLVKLRARHERDARGKAAEFERKYTDMVAAKDFGDTWRDGTRDRAMNLGLVRCMDDDEIDGETRETHTLIEWPRQLKEGVPRYDVCAAIPEGFVDAHALRFHPLHTFAYVGSDVGWQEPGRMGWWAMSTETPQSQQEYDVKFVEWMYSGDQSDVMYVVDCHI